MRRDARSNKPNQHAGDDKPDVTVLTPSYAYGEFIEDAIRSVSQQNGLCIQHIVQDAGSKDETLNILRRFDRTLQWHSEPDRGQSEALNKAFESAEAPWVGWLNADEFYLPGSLPALLQAGTEMDADVIFGDAVFVDVRGRFLRLLPQHHFQPLVLRWYGMFVPSCATLFRREALGPEPWDTSLRRIMDWDLILRLMMEGKKIVHVSIPAGAFRVHGAQVTSNPPSDFWREYKLVEARYGLHRRDGRNIRRPAGRVLHRVSKLVSGAYVRQTRARRYRGTDLRWFREIVGHVGTMKLLTTTYPDYARKLTRLV